MELPVMPRAFDPTKEDLISYYLKNKITKTPYPESGTISEVAIYEEKQNPWEKFTLQNTNYKWQPVMDSLGNEVPDCHRFFAFTRLSSTGKTSKSRNIQKKRAAGWGTWHGTSKLHEVYSSKKPETVVGNCRVLTFRTNNGKKTVGQWTIYEYTIDPRGHPEIQRFPDWSDQVVCEIRRDDSKFSIAGKVFKNGAAEAAADGGDRGAATAGGENQGGVAAVAAVKVEVEEEDAAPPSVVAAGGDGAAQPPDYYGAYKELDADEMLDGILMF